MRRFSGAGRWLPSLTAAFIVASLAWLGTHPTSASPTDDEQATGFNPANSRSLDSDIAARLEELRSRQAAWAWQDLIERGRLAIAGGELSGAASAFEMAVQSASNVEERTVAQYYWGTSLLALAQSLGRPEKGVVDQVAQFWAEGEGPDPRRVRLLRLAGEVLNDAQASSPGSRDIAAGRITAWSMLEDEVETIAAEHQLRVIDPSMEGTARSKLALTAQVVLAVCKAGKVILLNFEFDGIMKPEKRVALLELMDSGAAAAELTLKIVPKGPRK